MATEKLIAANRANAKKRGCPLDRPRSAEGKAASSRNALKSGLYAREITLVKEQPYELERLEKQFTLEYCPVTPTERALVDTLAHLEWMTRRYRKVETKVWDHVKDRMSSEDHVANYLGNAFYNEEPAIQRVICMRNAAQRQFRETVTQLRALQAERKASGEPSEAPPLREEDDFLIYAGRWRRSHGNSTFPHRP